MDSALGVIGTLVTIGLAIWGIFSWSYRMAFQSLASENQLLRSANAELQKMVDDLEVKNAQLQAKIEQLESGESAFVFGHGIIFPCPPVAGF